MSDDKSITLADHVLKLMTKDNNKILSCLLSSNEKALDGVRDQCTRIFTPTTTDPQYKLPKEGVAIDLLNNAGAILEKGLKNFQPTIDTQKLNEIEKLIASALSILREDLNKNHELTNLLSDAPEKNQRVFMRDIETSFMFKVITDLYMKNYKEKDKGISKDASEFVRIMTNTRDESFESRINKINDKFKLDAPKIELQSDVELPQTRQRR